MDDATVFYETLSVYQIPFILVTSAVTSNFSGYISMTRIVATVTK